MTSRRRMMRMRSVMSRWMRAISWLPVAATRLAILVAYAPAGIQSSATGPRFQKLLEQARLLPNVTSVSPPLSSRDGRYAYVVLQYDRQAAAIPDPSVQALERLADTGG